MPVTKRGDKTNITEDSNIDAIEQLIQDLKLDFRMNLEGTEDYFSPTFLQSVTDCFEIIAKYKDPKQIVYLSSIELQNDCLALQALLCLTSQTISQLMAESEYFEDAIKVHKSKTLLEAKRLKKTNGLKVSIEDLKDVTQVVVEDMIDESGTKKVAAEFAKFFYYTVRDFSAFLDKATARAIKFDPEVKS